MPKAPLFPYTTLFRSQKIPGLGGDLFVTSSLARLSAPGQQTYETWTSTPVTESRASEDVTRSEEDTSELQSRQYPVCSPLLEKENQQAAPSQTCTCTF